MLRLQVVLLYWACILLAFAMNLPGGKGQYLDKLSTLGMAWTGAYGRTAYNPYEAKGRATPLSVLGLVIVVPVMLGKSEIRHDAHYAFTAFDNTFSGFSNTWSWLLASLTPVYCMVAAGNVSTLCEEVKSPEKQVPKVCSALPSLRRTIRVQSARTNVPSQAMWLPVVLNGVLGTRESKYVPCTPL